MVAWCSYCWTFLWIDPGILTLKLSDKGVFPCETKCQWEKNYREAIIYAGIKIENVGFICSFFCVVHYRNLVSFTQVNRYYTIVLFSLLEEINNQWIWKYVSMWFALHLPMVRCSQEMTWRTYLQVFVPINFDLSWMDLFHHERLKQSIHYLRYTRAGFSSAWSQGGRKMNHGCKGRMYNCSLLTIGFNQEV